RGLPLPVETQEDARGGQVVAQVVHPHAGHRDAELAETEQVDAVGELPNGGHVHIAVAALHPLQVLPGVALGGDVDVLVQVVWAVPVQVAFADQVTGGSGHLAGGGALVGDSGPVLLVYLRHAFLGLVGDVGADGDGPVGAAGVEDGQRFAAAAGQRQVEEDDVLAH